MQLDQGLRCNRFPLAFQTSSFTRKGRDRDEFPEDSGSIQRDSLKLPSEVAGCVGNRIRSLFSAKVSFLETAVFKLW
jgi:hypothetical protein